FGFEFEAVELALMQDEDVRHSRACAEGFQDRGLDRVSAPPIRRVPEDRAVRAVRMEVAHHGAMDAVLGAAADGHQCLGAPPVSRYSARRMAPVSKSSRSFSSPAATSSRCSAGAVSISRLATSANAARMMTPLLIPWSGS